MVRCGIDRIGEYPHLFEGKRLAMVTSVSGVTLDGKPGYVVFHERYPLRFLFSPEHGLQAQCGNGEDVTEPDRDASTGLPVISLYGGQQGKHIPPRVMEQLDGIVYDIQDLGTRFYTFISTMLLVMEDCARAGKELIILDRPAVLGGRIVEGGLLDPAYRSFIGPYSLCTRYGLTAGELAKMVNEETGLGCRLDVLPCEGWTRGQMFPDTGNTWVKPSTAIADFETALLYPGMCIFEGTSLSEGRGTARPFGIIGAPFLDGQQLSREMNALGLPGVAFSPARFCPTASKFKGQVCSGVELKITSFREFRTVRTGVTLLYRILEQCPGKVTLPSCAWSDHPLISFLTGSGIFEGEIPPLSVLLETWEQDSAAFSQRKQAYHIYD